MKLLFSALIISGLLACGGGPTCPEPIYGGKASDEALLTLRDAEKRVITDDSKAVTFIKPTEGQTFDGTAMPPTFLWTSPLTASLTPPGRSKARFSLYSLFVSNAYAHLPPVSGPIYLLRIARPGKTCPFELLTTRTEWTVEGSSWATLKESAGQSLPITVISAYLTDNRITEGPYTASKPVSFTIAK